MKKQLSKEILTGNPIRFISAEWERKDRREIKCLKTEKNRKHC